MYVILHITTTWDSPSNSFEFIMDELRKFIKDNFHKSQTGKEREIISEEFRKIINSYSLENDSNTPDFILADYLVDCLENFHITQSRRAMWYNPENKR